MRITFERTTPQSSSSGLAYTLIGITGFVIARYYAGIFSIVPPCMFRHLTGIPCPACGALHSGYYMAHFLFLKSITANPFFFVVYLGLLFIAFNTLLGYITKKNLHFVCSEREYRLVRIMIICALPLNWIYLIIVMTG